MFNIPEQFSAATKANFEAQIALASTFANKTFESVEKLIDLNIELAKSSLEDSTLAAKQLFTAKDPQEFFSLSTGQSQPNAEKAINYGRSIINIASSTQAELAKATEAQIAENGRKVVSIVDEMAKHAPAGSEQFVAFFKAFVGNANAGYEQLSKTTKQAVETIESNINSAAEQLTQVAEKPASRAKKSA